MTEKLPPQDSKGLRRVQRTAIVLVLGYVLLAGFCQMFGRFYIYRYEQYRIVHNGTPYWNEPYLFVPDELTTTPLLPFVLDFKEKRCRDAICVFDDRHSKEVVLMDVNYLALQPIGEDEIVLVDESIEHAKRILSQEEISSLLATSSADGLRAVYELPEGLIGKSFTATMDTTVIQPDGSTAPFRYVMEWRIERGTEFRKKPQRLFDFGW